MSASHRRRPAWLTGRVAVLLVLLLVAGSVAAWRVADRLDRPSAGDRYDVSYEGDTGCGFVTARADGLILQGLQNLDEPPVPAGEGTLVLTKVWDLADSDGLGVNGTLTLADGTDLTVGGGTEGEVFLSLGCAIRD